MNSQRLLDAGWDLQVKKQVRQQMGSDSLFGEVYKSESGIQFPAGPVGNFEICKMLSVRPGLEGQCLFRELTFKINA